MKLRQKPNLKAKLSPTLKSWIPILESSSLDLEETLEHFAAQNPFIEISSNICQNLQKSIQFPAQTRQINKPIIKEHSKKYTSDVIEQISIDEKSLYEVLESQIIPPLFATRISQEIAYKIIDNINDEGYFEGSIDEIAESLNIDSSLVEQIRKRFSKLDPSGIGAIDNAESMIFQLDDFDISDEVYDLACKIIRNLNNHKKYSKLPHYDLAMKILRKMRRPPAIDYLPKTSQIIPDIFITQTSEGFEVSINSSHYPDIIINDCALDSQNSAIKEKLKEARDLLDAINMRKSTIQKLGLMILEYQYDFFNGGDIKPLKLSDIAEELGYAASTISRAVGHKYLECNRGIFPIKSFFTTAISSEVSNSAIKDFILERIKCEDRKNPLSDVKILELIEAKFGVKMVRRTITKYRKQLKIGSSGERKRLYEVGI